MRAEPAVSASGTGFRPSLRSVLRHWPSAWVWLQHPLDGRERRARQRHQLVAYAQEMLADDVQAGFGQQVMDVGDAAGHRVLDRDHGVARIPALHGRQRVLEGGAGQRLEIGIRLEAGQMRVGARLALVGRRARSVLRCGRVRPRACGLAGSGRRLRFCGPPWGPDWELCGGLAEIKRASRQPVIGRR